MATSAYYEWVDDGRPFTVAKPIAETLAKLKAARPEAAKAGCFGSIGDTAHLTANKPQDHCPFSTTGWPLSHPYPYVTAGDIMHRPDLGVDCTKIHAGLLAAAKAGLLPWLKYWIWQGKRYDVRNNWAPVTASGHYDHIHLSSRTDHINTSIGSWHPLEEADMTPDESQKLKDIHYAIFESAGDKRPAGSLSGLASATAAGVGKLGTPPPATVDVKALAALLEPAMEAAAERAVRKVLGAVDGATVDN